MSTERLTALLEAARDSPWLVVALLGAFVIGGLFFVSVWLVIFQTGLLLPPPLSCGIALAGALLSASFFFLVGRLGLGAFLMRRASNRVVRAVYGARLEHIVALRLLPILPYTLVNVCAGALGVPWGVFLVGTAVGMAPGVLAVTLLSDRALALLRDPGPTSWAIVVAAAGLLMVGAAWLRKRALRAQRAPGPEDEPGSSRGA